jgi:hypothetical protein
MGQVITFPAKPKPRAEVRHERRAALITGLCGLTYLLGFFIIGPMLAMSAFGFATTAHAGSAITCVAGLLVTWALTRLAYKHIA